jgi:trans-aconitate 2-methyltransferase
MTKEKTAWDPEIYSNHSHFQYQEAMQLIHDHPFRGDEKILDIGCGDGRLSEYIATQVPRGQVVAIDSSSEMIAYAQKNYSRANLTFHELSAEEIRYKEEFDIIFSSFCLHWVEDKQQIFNLIYHSLKANGQLLCAMVIRNEVMAQARTELLSLAQWEHYFIKYEDPSKTMMTRNYKECAIAAGFKINSHEIKITRVEFESEEKLNHFMRNLTLLLSRLPAEELKSAFMDAYVMRYLALSNRSSADFTIDFDVVTLKVEKNKTIMA